MNLIGEKVKSISFGVGVIIEQVDKTVVVEFTSKQTKFMYPDAFEKFLTAENNDLQTELLKMIDEKNKEIADEKAINNIKMETDKYSQEFRSKGYEKKFGKEFHVDFLAKHPILTYQQVEKQYGITISGFGRGINITDDSIVLISSIGKSRSGFVYHDRFTPDGDYIYSGEGKSGDQSLKGGNLAIKNAAINGKDIYLFVKFSPQEYYYQGIYSLIEYTYENEEDADGNLRKEFKFRLRKI